MGRADRRSVGNAVGAGCARRVRGVQAKRTVLFLVRTSHRDTEAQSKSRNYKSEDRMRLPRVLCALRGEILLLPAARQK